MHSVIRFTLLVLLAAALAPLAASGGAQEPAQEPLRFVPPGAHPQGVGMMALSPDGKYAATTGVEGAVRVWEVDTGREVRVFRHARRRNVHALAFTPDSRQLAMGDIRGGLRLQDVATGELIRAYEGHEDFIYSVAFSPDGRLLLSGSEDRRLRLWDVESGELVREDDKARIYAVAFSPDGQHYFSAGRDQRVRVWEAETGEEVRVFSGHRGFLSYLGPWVLATGMQAVVGFPVLFFTVQRPVLSFAISPDGQYGLSGSVTGTVRLWDTSTGRVVHSLRGHRKAVQAVAFSPDGKHALTGSLDDTLRLWDVSTGEEVRVFRGHEGSVWAVAFQGAGDAFVSSGEDGARVWDTATGEELRRFGKLSVASPALGLSPDGRQVLIGGRDHVLEHWDLTSGRPLRRWRWEGQRHEHSPNNSFKWWCVISTAAFSTDGTQLITSTNAQDEVMLWDAATGEQLHSLTLPGVPYRLQAVALTPDGERMGCAHGREVIFVELASGRRVQTVRATARRATIKALAISADGRQLLFGDSEANAGVLDLPGARTRRDLEGHTDEVVAVGLTPDGERALTASVDGTLRVWEAATGRQLVVCEVPGEGLRAAFSPDGARAVTSSSDGVLRLWDLEEGREVRAFSGNGHAVRRLIFSPDGEHVLSRSEDGTVRLWDVAAGRELYARQTYYEGEDWLLWTPDGRFDGTEAAIALANFERGPERIPAAELAERFHVPGLAGRVLGGG